jgi:hypothetical protein
MIQPKAIKKFMERKNNSGIPRPKKSFRTINLGQISARQFKSRQSQNSRDSIQTLKQETPLKSPKYEGIDLEERRSTIKTLGSLLQSEGYCTNRSYVRGLSQYSFTSSELPRVPVEKKESTFKQSSSRNFSQSKSLFVEEKRTSLANKCLTHTIIPVLLSNHSSSEEVEDENKHEEEEGGKKTGDENLIQKNVYPYPFTPSISESEESSHIQLYSHIHNDSHSHLDYQHSSDSDSSSESDSDSEGKTHSVKKKKRDRIKNGKKAKRERKEEKKKEQESKNKEQENNSKNSNSNVNINGNADINAILPCFITMKSTFIDALLPKHKYLSKFRDLNNPHEIDILQLVNTFISLFLSFFVNCVLFVD